jgi:hypothetical protein
VDVAKDSPHRLNNLRCQLAELVELYNHQHKERHHQDHRHRHKG